MTKDTGPLDSEALYRRRDLQHSLLDQAEEFRLLAEARAGDPASIDALIRHNQRLVIAIAYQYWRTRLAGDQELMDLVQFGNLGLLEAISRWDASRGVRFSTYATHWVRNMVRRGGIMHGTTIALTARQGELMFAMRKSMIRLSHQLQRFPTPGEIAADSRLSLPIVAGLMPL